MNIAFRDHEFRMETDLETGALTVLIPVETVRERLGVGEGTKGQRDKGTKESALTRDQVLDFFDQSLAASGWERWIALNEQQTRKGRRTPAKLEKIRQELKALSERYGMMTLAMAMLRCKEPKHANVAYVKAILKNEGGNHGKTSGKDDDFNRQLDAALSNV